MTTKKNKIPEWAHLTFDCDLGKVSFLDHCRYMLREIWLKGASFSGKRPFGNGAWMCDVYAGMVHHDLISGSLDDEGDLMTCDDKRGLNLMLELIDLLGDHD